MERENTYWEWCGGERAGAGAGAGIGAKRGEAGQREKGVVFF